MKNVVKNKNKYLSVLLLLSMIIFFEPQMFKEYNFSYLLVIDKVYRVAKLIISALIIYMYFKKNKPSSIVKWMIFFQCLCLLSTIINSGDLFRLFGPALTTIVMIMTAELLISEKMINDILKRIIIYFRFCYLINLLSIILVDFFGIYNDNLYFLGIDNRWIFTFLPWMFFEIVYSINKEDYRNSYIVFALIEFVLLYKWSVAAFLTNLLWIIPLLVKKKYYYSKFSLHAYYVLFVTNISIVIFKIQNIFGNLLSKLHKDVTLSGRTIIWDTIFDNIRSKAILGYGMHSLEFDKSFFSSKYDLNYLKVGHAHNSLMTIFYRYGIVGVIVNIAIYLKALYKVKENYKSKYANCILMFLIITIILSFFDTIDCSALYLVLGLAYGIDKIKWR